MEVQDRPGARAVVRLDVQCGPAAVVCVLRMPSGTAIRSIIALNPAGIASTGWGPSGRGCRSIASTCARCSLLMDVLLGVPSAALYAVASKASDETVSLPGFFADLVRCETRLYNALSDRLRERHGIVMSQFEFLRCLRDRPGSRVADLAAEFAIGIGATSKGRPTLPAKTPLS